MRANRASMRAAARVRQAVRAACGSNGLTRLLSFIAALISLVAASASLLLLYGSSVTLPLPYAASWYPCIHLPGLKVLAGHRAKTQYRAVVYGDAGQDTCARADPGILAH